MPVQARTHVATSLFLCTSPFTPMFMVVVTSPDHSLSLPITTFSHFDVVLERQHHSLSAHHPPIITQQYSLPLDATPHLLIITH